MFNIRGDGAVKAGKRREDGPSTWMIEGIPTEVSEIWATTKLVKLQSLAI